MMRCEKGFTLIEIMAVLVIISVLTGVGFKKFDEISSTASAKVLGHALSELNSRELLVWAMVKMSDQGWATDDSLFVQLDKDLGTDYDWTSGPAATGGILQLRSTTVTLSRAPSTGSSPGKWAVN